VREDRDASNRRGGWWGIAFLVLLTLSASMATVPTADDPSGTIRDFYADNRSIVVLAQMLGALALVPFVLFASATARTLAVGPARWTRGAAIVVVLAEVLTNLIPIVFVVIGDAGDGTIHRLARAGDLADVALFLALAGYAVVSSIGRPAWLSALGFAAAAVMVVHAVLSATGTTVIENVAALALIVLILAQSVVLLRAGRPAAGRVAAGD
jgi:hypothetical protein